MNNKKAQLGSLKFIFAIFLVIILLSTAEYNSGSISRNLESFSVACVDCSPLTIVFIQSLPALIIGALIIMGVIAWRAV